MRNILDLSKNLILQKYHFTKKLVNITVFSEKTDVPQHPNHSMAILIMTCCDLENVVHIMKHEDKFG